MKIAIIGAGFTGLTAAYRLLKKGHSVQIYEQGSVPGGLAMGFKKSKWQWSLEHHYHHIFTSDSAIIDLAKEIGVKFNFYRPNTSSLVDDKILQLDSPLKLLQFERLTVFERLRMGAVLFYLKYLSSFKSLENFAADDFLRKAMGETAYKLLWEPLMIAKFGPYCKEIAMSWFYARIKARTTKLGYPEGGFQNLAESLAAKVIELGGEIFYNSAVTQILSEKKQREIVVKNKKFQFDKVLFTGPNSLFAKLSPQLDKDYVKKLLEFKGIGALNMVLELKKPFFKNDVYWLSICDTNFPFLAAVEHTNFISKKYYGNNHVVYIGNYLASGHKYYNMTKDDLFNVYKPYLEKLHPNFEKNLIGIDTFTVPFAQPIVTKNFSKKILSHKTPLNGIYLANMQQVYPWDRGTNFAVAMGYTVSEIMSGK
jgi:protoporphyrinogen oxidase